MSMSRVHMTEGATCSFCDKQNHTEAQCWAKHPELRPKNYNPGGAPDAKRPRQGLAMAVPGPPRRRAAEFEDRLGRGDEEFFSPGYPRQMVAMGVAEEGDVNGVEPGFYVGEMWVSMDVPVVHVRPPFQMMAPRARGGRSGGGNAGPVRASERLRSMARGEGSSLAGRLGPQSAGTAQGGTRQRLSGADDLGRVI